jgi:hypothetical protein
VRVTGVDVVVCEDKWCRFPTMILLMAQQVEESKDKKQDHRLSKNAYNIITCIPSTKYRNKH